MGRWLSNPRYVSWTPVITTGLLESANVAQLVEMWTERTAAGQNLWGWLMVTGALCCWYNYYRVITPTELKAQYATLVGIGFNLSVVGSVLYFKYLV
jgi:multidrug transporter EmrE-like cation transporter